MAQPIRSLRLRRGAAVAAGSGANLFVGGTLLVAAMLFGAWWLVVLAVVAYSSLVMWQASHPERWPRWLPSDTLPLLRLPDPARLSDPLLRSTVFAIASAHAEVSRVLGELPQEARRTLNLDLTTESLEELEDGAARLAERAEEMIRYLQTARRDVIQGEIRRLQDLVLSAHDPSARHEYQAALDQRLEQLQAVDDISRAYERVTASLLRVVATIESLPARIMRVRVLEAEAREDLAGDLGLELGRMNGDLLASEQALRGLLEPPHLALNHGASIAG